MKNKIYSFYIQQSFINQARELIYMRSFSSNSYILNRKLITLHDVCLRVTHHNRKKIKDEQV